MTACRQTAALPGMGIIPLKPIIAGTKGFRMDFALDPFELLGVGSDATDREIKKRYRLLSKRFHPDLNPDEPETAEKFKQVQEAYEILMCSSTRRQTGEVTTAGQSTIDPFRDSSRPFYQFFEALKTYGTNKRHTREKP
jgi:curved DNA-binding protein CbpA